MAVPRRAQRIVFCLAVSLIFTFFFSSSGMTQNTKYTLPPDKKKLLDNRFFQAYAKVGTYYVNCISRFNPRLTPLQSELIAKSIIYYTMYFNDFYNGGAVHKVDPRLVMALVAVESGFKPLAVSPKGAMGLGQLMPFKAKELGIGKFAFSPQHNIFGTVRTLRGLYDLYTAQGHPFPVVYQFSLAAYNAGSGAVAKYKGVPPYSETQRYVVKVTALFRQLAPEYFRQ